MRNSAEAGPDTAPVARLLVVDDSGAIRRTIAALLEAAGYQVETAVSGEAAFERCLTERFDLVVSDVTMGALSGMQLCRLLRSDPQTADMPIVLLTARDDPRSRFWGRHAGARGYVTKEAMHEQLLPLVQQALADARPPRSDTIIQPLRQAKPLERLSQVLDDLLFKAVVASDVRKLVESASDRATFQRAVLSLASDVASFDYLVFLLDQDRNPTYAVYGREPWSEAMQTQLTRTLELPETAQAWLVEGPQGDLADSARPALDEPRRFVVQAGDEPLGELIAWSQGKRLATRDVDTLGMLAQDIGLVAKTMFLMEETRRLAFTDHLTGLFNRHHTADVLADELKRSRRYGTPLSILLCDIDHFKAVNDTYGHNAGDEVIKQVARILSGAVRTVDCVARWGGEEFLLLLPSTSPTGARIVAERIRQQVANAPAIPDGPERVTLSLGVASYADDASPHQLIERADRALYRAKGRGRNRVEADDGPGSGSPTG